jgi:hypothetical protein
VARRGSEELLNTCISGTRMWGGWILSFERQVHSWVPGPAHGEFPHLRLTCAIHVLVLVFPRHLHPAFNLIPFVSLFTDQACILRGPMKRKSIVALRAAQLSLLACSQLSSQYQSSKVSTGSSRMKSSEHPCIRTKGSPHRLHLYKRRPNGLQGTRKKVMQQLPSKQEPS